MGADANDDPTLYFLYAAICWVAQLVSEGNTYHTCQGFNLPRQDVSDVHVKARIQAGIH